MSHAPAEYLFPRRWTRRDFLQTVGAAAAAGLLGTRASQAAPQVATRIGEGRWAYTVDESWGTLPEGMKYGFGCAVVVDSQDRVFVTSRSESPCVTIFDKDGQLLEAWGNDFAQKVGYTTKEVAQTAHGLYWSKEGNDEFLYFTENKPGSRVYKTDLKGRILYQIGQVASESDTSAKFDFTNPTDVAVAPNGDIYVVDGYGSQLVHQFDKNFKLKKTIGGKGADHGKFNVCHGVWVSTLGAEPEVYIADRANGRLEVYSLDLEYKRTLPDFRAPCCFYQHDEHLYVPELGGRVSILDAKDRVVARLGEGKPVPDAELPAHPERFGKPHAMTVASNGDMYVVEWVAYGRPRRLRHTPA